MKSKYSSTDSAIKKCLPFSCCFDVTDMSRRSVTVYMRLFSSPELGWVCGHWASCLILPLKSMLKHD